MKGVGGTCKSRSRSSTTSDSVTESNNGSIIEIDNGGILAIASKRIESDMSYITLRHSSEDSVARFDDSVLKEN